MRLIARLIKKHLGGFIIAISFLLAEAISDLLQPFMMSKIIDEGVASSDLNKVWSFGIGMLAFAAIGAIGAVGRNYFASKTSQVISKELRSDLYKKVQGLSHESVERLEPAAIITRITNDVTQIQFFINGCMRILMKVPITCVGSIIFICIQAPRNLPIVAVVSVVSLIWIAINMKIGYKRFKKMQGEIDNLNENSREYLNSIRVVKAFNTQEMESKRFSESADNLADASLEAAKVNVFFSPLINLTVNLGIVAVFLACGYTDLGLDFVEPGKLMSLINYITQLAFSLNMVSMILNNMVRATASSNRVQEILDATNTLDNGQLKKGKDEVVLKFDDVTFAYPDAERPAIKNISFDIQKGQMCGVIGSTGSGKTSLTKLILRFFDTTQGSISLDGVDLKDYDISSLREQISFVPQKPLLFTGTIKKNLLWGNSTATDEQIEKVARLSCSEDFIQAYERGYETMIGQGGVNLSGGQKQRLSIARAMLKDAKLLILDDCTSALDASTEAKVLSGIYESGYTTLLISQRISTVRRTDKIICMDAGEVVGVGTHEELMESCTVYQEIYESQVGGATDGKME